MIHYQDFQLSNKFLSVERFKLEMVGYGEPERGRQKERKFFTKDEVKKMHKKKLKNSS